jgi:hypothetical protein
MALLTGTKRLVFLVFFASHVIVTFLMAGQAVLPKYPEFLRKMSQSYVHQFKDTLLQAPYEPWFQSLVFCEVVLQVPFFIVAVYVLWTNATEPTWFRTSCLVYGSHASTTLVPILATTLLNSINSLEEKAILIGFYLPYMLIPFWLVYLCATNADDGKPKSS